jgi:UDP-glucose 4-epimerase
MTILVTGGAGYIGSHTSIALLDAGHTVVIVDNFSNAKRDMVETIRRISGRDIAYYEGDIRECALLERVFTENAIDAAIHFAGLKSAPESVLLPLKYYNHNLSGAFTLLETMARHGVKRIVFSSSASVYDPSGAMPLREDAPVGPISPYGATKLMIERVLQDIAAADPAWAACSLRYFNLIGAHESGLIGDDPTDVPKNLPPYIAQVAAGRLPEVLVTGDDYPTPDGTGIRDYIHVSDLVDGHIAALNYIAAHTGAQAVNLGTGQGYSVFEMLHGFERACGHPIPFTVQPRRPGDPAVSYAAVDKAEQLLGWKAKRSLDEMCASAWNFAKRRYS